MAYVDPTPAQIKARWPQFAAVPDATIQVWINTAKQTIDHTWCEDSYTYAVELLTAHYLVMNGLGTGAEAEANAAGMSGFSTIKSGQLTLTRGSASWADGVEAPWNTTPFGAEFYWIMRRCKPAIAVGVAPDLGCKSAYAKDWPWGTGGWKNGPLW